MSNLRNSRVAVSNLGVKGHFNGPVPEGDPLVRLSLNKAFLSIHVLGVV